MDIQAFLTDWIEASNNYDIPKYLDKYLPDAILDDPSVGKTFQGHKGIEAYFTNYFIDYNTQTKLIRLDSSGPNAYIEVEFTGTFPEGKIGGSFDFTFKNDKIATVKAALI